MPCQPTYPARTARQSGVGMIEVLITLAILSFGLLGIAALNLLSKRSNFEATERSGATALANYILERMRSNPGGLVTYAGTLETPAAALGGNTMADEPTPNCTTTVCDNPNDLAFHDRWELEKLLDNNTSGLIQPTACLTTTVPAASTDRPAPKRSRSYGVARRRSPTPTPPTAAARPPASMTIRPAATTSTGGSFP
jgi:type IV pilus modification protein PilV